MTFKKDRNRVIIVRYWLLWLVSALYSLGVLAQSDSYHVIDSFGVHHFQSPPMKVVVTDWTLLEQLLAIEVVPLGAPELPSFKEIYPFLDVPDSIQDIGYRKDPNFSVIAGLQPDLIILGTDQRMFERPMSNLGRVMFFQNFSHRFDNNGTTAQKRLGQLASVFNMRETAQQRLNDYKQLVANMAKQINDCHSHVPPKVALVQLLDNEKAMVFGSHSLLGQVMLDLKLENPFGVLKNKFGEKVVPLESVITMQPAYLFYFDLNQDGKSKLGDTRDRLNTIDISPIWPYGGVNTMMRLAETLSDNLVNNCKTKE